MASAASYVVYGNDMATTTSATTVNCVYTWGVWNNAFVTTAASNCIWEGWLTAAGQILQEHAQGQGLGAWAGLGTGGLGGLGDGLVAARAARAQAEANEIMRCQQAKREKAAAAKASAEELLLSQLNESQKTEFRKWQRFVVHSRDGERVYRVDYGVAGNVKLLGVDGKKIIATYCIHPQIECPVEDIMLAQKLLLDADEAQFLKIANRRAVAA